MSEKLKPCPFCGSSEHYIRTRQHGFGNTVYYVYCPMCGGESGWADTEPVVSEMWNRRAESAEVADLRGRLAAMEAERDASLIELGKRLYESLPEQYRAMSIRCGLEPEEKDDQDWIEWGRRAMRPAPAADAPTTEGTPR